MSRFIQGSWCDDEGCPRDYQFEQMQRALSGEDKRHEGIDQENIDDGQDRPAKAQ